MPLVRCEVRNEYGLGQPQLYREVNNEDPKAVLDGVAVAGLVGILRQLGDLAEFAAEVFHGIQEQVLITANRSHKLIVRVQNIEAKLPPLEKAVLAQTSHIHFAYTAGSRWHARIRENNNLFIYNDLPWFIMNSYEVCRDPPQLHLLDRFDSGGPGSCIKRYSDPMLFRRTSDNSNEFGAEKIQKVEKSRRAKKKRSSRRTGASVYTSVSVSSQSGRIRFTPNTVNGHASPSHTASTAHRSSQRTEASAPSESLSNHSGRIKSTPSTHNELASPSPTASTADMTIKSDVGDRSCSFDSRTRSSFIEYSFGSSVMPEPRQSNVSSSFIHHHDITNSGSLDRQLEVADYFPQESSSEQIATSSSSFTWDEKVEVVEWWYTQQSDENEDPEILITNTDLDIQQTKTDKGEDADTEKALLAGENTSKSSSSDGVESEPDNYMDALNAIESESENDLDCQMKHEAEKLDSCVDEEGVQEELNKAMMCVDEVPLKTESMAVHGLFTENELTSDLVDSIFSNYAVLAKTSGNVVTYSIPDHSPGFESSKSYVDIDNSSTEFTVRYAVESDSENDHDYQMKHEVEKLASCVDKEGLQEELNEARMHVEDEVPLKMESITAHDLFTENELTSDILNPLFSNYVVHAETSNSEATNSIPDHSPGFEGSKCSYAIDNSKGEFTARNAVESEAENDRDCQLKHDVEKVATCVDKEGVQEELSEAMVHVADEVTLKMESIALHDLCTENEHTSDLLNSIFSNCAVQAETSENADAHSMPDHLPGFGCSKTSDAIDNSKGEFTVNNPVESESENNLDYQMKHCLDEEGVQEEELNEAMAHVADEVTLKTESIAVHDRFTENEHTSDLLNSIFSNCAEKAETYSMPDHSRGFECSKSSDAIDNSTGKFTVIDAVESESENDLDCQVKHEVEELDSCVDKEGVREELNKAMMHVVDEVPLKAESIAAHDLFTENEQTSDLPNSIVLNCAVQVKTSENAETYSIPNHSPGFACSKSSDAIDYSKAEFTVSNSVESESQNDLDCQMKHELKLACVDKEGVQVELSKATMHDADEIPLKAESISAHDLFPENEHTSDLANSIFSIHAVQEETSGNAVTYSEPDHSPGFEGPKSLNGIEYSKAEFTVSNPLSETFSQDQLLSDKSKNASCNSQVSLDKTTSFRPVSLWTNGGLLGLEPSKPPDFVALGNSSRDSVTNEVSVVCPENHTLIVQDNCETGKAKILSTGRDLSSDDSISRHGHQDVEIGKTKDSQHVDGSHQVYVGGVNEKGATPQNQLLPDANVEASSNEACPENDGNSFQIFPFGNRFFVNNFRRRMPSVTEVRLEPDSSLRLEQKGRHANAPQTTHWKSLNGDLGQEPFVESLASSPPLEHMKISFRPFDGFESSKLQLKLPDGKSRNGSVRDMFLSFQLVPEPSTSLQMSDSEEDTFCRSYPYMSDESPSHHSESDSELWESGECLDRTNHLLYDETLGRVSSIDLGSGCLDPEDISPNCLQHEPECKNACTENDANPPPSFNAVNSAPHEETENKLKTIGSQYLKVTSPMPPPLPPAQWGILKPPSAVENDQQHATSETGDQESDTKPLECSAHHCPKQELDDGQVNGEATAVNANGKEQEKLSLHSEANNAANSKEIDRNEDFLHQIRAKSFMLNPTTTAKTSFMQDPAKNDKFASRLLRKASAIRQAVGSDDGEDSWSDA